VVKQKPPILFQISGNRATAMEPENTPQKSPAKSMHKLQLRTRRSPENERTGEAELELGQGTKAQKAEEPGGKKKGEENWTVPGSNPASSGPSP
jgi:hypothetical protein